MRDWEKDDNGDLHSTFPGLSLSVLNDGETKLFFRNAMKIAIGQGTSGHKRWVVGELNGVRVYFDGEHVILTTRDMYP